MAALNAHSASHARASGSAVSGKNFTGPLRRPAPVKASTCASHRGLPTTAIFSKSLRWLKKKSVSPHCSPRSHPEKFSSRTRSLTAPAAAIISTNWDCAASSSDFFSSPPTRRTQRRSSCCSRLALMDVAYAVSREPRGLTPFDDLLQNPQPFRLHWAHSSSRQKPHALLLGVAVDD